MQYQDLGRLTQYQFLTVADEDDTLWLDWLLGELLDDKPLLPLDTPLEEILPEDDENGTEELDWIGRLTQYQFLIKTELLDDSTLDASELGTNDDGLLDDDLLDESDEREETDEGWDAADRLELDGIGRLIQYQFLVSIEVLDDDIADIGWLLDELSNDDGDETADERNDERLLDSTMLETDETADDNDEDNTEEIDDADENTDTDDRLGLRIQNHNLVIDDRLDDTDNELDATTDEDEMTDGANEDTTDDGTDETCGMTDDVIEVIEDDTDDC